MAILQLVIYYYYYYYWRLGNLKYLAIKKIIIKIDHNATMFQIRNSNFFKTMFMINNLAFWELNIENKTVFN